MEGRQGMDEDLRLLYGYHKLEGEGQPNLPSKSSHWRHISHGAFKVLLLLIIGILISLLILAPRNGNHDFSIPTVVPKFAQVNQFGSWEPDPDFVDPRMFTDPELQSRLLHEWLIKLLPTSRGFIEVTDPQQFNLAPPRTYHPGEKPKYMITAFHQLHCVSYLIRAFSAARLRDASFVFDDVHLIHCFDYLRQGIICAADSTLEGNTSLADGTHHVCNNFGALKDWAGKNGASNVPYYPYPG